MNYYRSKKPRKSLILLAAFCTFVATLTMLWTDAGGMVM
jgi:hypothetical protein